MSRLNLNSLSLVYPSDSEQDRQITNVPSYVSLSPLMPPPDYTPTIEPRSPLASPREYVIRSPLGPPPGYVHRVREQRRCSVCRQTGHNRNACPSVPVPAENTPALPSVRAPRRCAFCRQTGHNRMTCPTADARTRDISLSSTRVRSDIQPVPSVLTVTNEQAARERLQRMIQSFLEFTLPGGTWRRPEEWITIFVTFLGSLSLDEVEEAILNPIPITRDVIRILYRIRPINTNIPRGVLGKDHAKKISLSIDTYHVETQKDNECFICNDNVCSLKASCGHEFCVTCVNAIIVTVKDKTSAPLCSFCRQPFTSLTTSDHFVYSTLADFINNL